MLEFARACLALVLGCGLAYGGWSVIEPHADPFSGTLILVNKEHRAPVAMPKLVFPQISPNKRSNANNIQMQPQAAEALEQMFAAAQVENGHILYGVSGYRSAGSQGVIYERRVEASGDSAKNWVAPGGYSEHQTGLVMDIAGESTLSSGLSQVFGESDEGIWVAENAHRFGFVVRYQSGWENITGYNHEPWHLRYVGLEHAERMYALDIPLEEYLVMLQGERMNEIRGVLGLEPFFLPMPTYAPTPEPKPAPVLEPANARTIAPTMTLSPLAVPSMPTGPNPFGTPVPTITP